MVRHLLVHSRAKRILLQLWFGKRRQSRRLLLCNALLLRNLLLLCLLLQLLILELFHLHEQVLLACLLVRLRIVLCLCH